MLNESERNRLKELAGLLKEEKENPSQLNEKAESEAQQQAMGMALAARRGEMNVSDLKGSARDIYYSDMTNKQIEDYAETSHEGIPEKVDEKESLSEFDDEEIELKRKKQFAHPYRKDYYQYDKQDKTTAFKDDDGDTRAY